MKKHLTKALVSVVLFCSLMCATSCGPTKLLPDDPQPPPPFFVPEKIRVALVLGSGGVRGMAHVGVIEELVNAGIHFDLIVGCSAGSIVGALYADNPDIESLKSSVWEMRTNSMLDIDIWRCRYGLSSGKSMHHIIDKYLVAETFSELQIPLVTVTTDLHTGESVPIGAGDLVTAIQASCSIPFVFVPCAHMGRIFVDGGVINPVPTKLAHDLGADYIIAVDLCELLGSTEPYDLFDVGARSAEIAFMWQNQACSRWANVVIRPKTCGVGAFNDKLKEKLYEAGKSAAREKIPEIKEALAKQASEMECKTSSSISQNAGRWRLIEPKCYTPKIYNENN